MHNYQHLSGKSLFISISKVKHDLSTILTFKKLPTFAFSLMEGDFHFKPTGKYLTHDKVCELGSGIITLRDIPLCEIH